MSSMRIIYCIAIATCLLTAYPAEAYIGPGPGLSMLGSLLALIGGIFLALLMVLAYPIRLLLKRRKSKRTDTNAS